jgi:hypothetical protein
MQKSAPSSTCTKSIDGRSWKPLVFIALCYQREQILADDLDIPYRARMRIEYGRHVDFRFEKSTVNPQKNKRALSYVYKIHEKLWKFGPEIRYIGQGYHVFCPF